MRSNQRSRGLLSVLGLALAAMLALGAFSATAQAGSWHVNGKTLGLGEYREFKSSGTFQMDMPGLGATFNCGETGKGKIFSTTLEQQLTLTCEIAGAEEECDITPISVNLVTGKDGRLHSTTAPTLMVIKSSGTFCWWWSESSVTDPKEGFAVKYGSEAVELGVASSALAGLGGQAVYITASSTWKLNNGAKFGYW